MGEIRNFQVNKDGSVTMNEPSKNSESTIIDILRIEHAKGGIFSSLHMKKRALKYAKRNDVVNPDIVVEKLILKHYPYSFKNIILTQRLITVILVFIILFWTIIGAIIPILIGWRICKEISKNNQLEETFTNASPMEEIGSKEKA